MRALWRNDGVLILDEPTSMLTPAGVQELGQVTRRLAERGVAIVFVTHKLREAYALGDRISVLRLGRLVGHLPKERLKAMNEAQVTEEVIRLMFGSSEGHRRDAETLVGRGHPRRRSAAIDRSGPPRLALADLSTSAEAALPAARRPAGMAGGSQRRASTAAAKHWPRCWRPAATRERSITLDGRHRPLDVAARRLSACAITDERLGGGTVRPSRSPSIVMKEIGARAVASRPQPLGPHPRHARARIGEFDIRTPSGARLGRLSAATSEVLLTRGRSAAPRRRLRQPTYGLDLQNIRIARDHIRAGRRRPGDHLIRRARQLIELSDRIGVIFQGRLTGVIDNAEAPSSASAC
jgi:simple sugar transport system ATP-binding protein